MVCLSHTRFTVSGDFDLSDWQSRYSSLSLRFDDYTLLPVLTQPPLRVFNKVISYSFQLCVILTWLFIYKLLNRRFPRHIPGSESSDCESRARRPDTPSTRDFRLLIWLPGSTGAFHASRHNITTRCSVICQDACVGDDDEMPQTLRCAHRYTPKRHAKDTQHPSRHHGVQFVRNSKLVDVLVACAVETMV